MKCWPSRSKPRSSTPAISRASKTEVQKHLSHEQQPIPADIDYDAVTSLSFEVRQKLKTHRPETIGQAARVSGVTLAAISCC